MRLIDEPVLDEYYAMVVRRWDANLRDVLNRSLQRLKASGRLEEIYSAWFAKTACASTSRAHLRAAVRDKRALAGFPTDAPVPDRPVAGATSGQPLRGPV